MPDGAKRHLLTFRSLGNLSGSGRKRLIWEVCSLDIPPTEDDSPQDPLTFARCCMRYEKRRAWAALSVGLMAFFAGCGGDEIDASDDPRWMDARDGRASDSQLVDLPSDLFAGDATTVGDASSADRIRDVVPAESDVSFDGAPSDVIDVSVDPPSSADALSDVADASIDPPRSDDADAQGDAGTADSGRCPGTTGGAIDLGRVVSDSANLYFIDRNVCAIKAVPKAGGTPVTLVQSTTPIHDMATDGSNFYFTTATNRVPAGNAV